MFAFFRLRAHCQPSCFSCQVVPARMQLCLDGLRRDKPVAMTQMYRAHASRISFVHCLPRNEQGPRNASYFKTNEEFTPADIGLHTWARC